MAKTKPRSPKNDVMALALRDEATLPGPIRAVYDKSVEKLGFVPNVLRAFTLRPRKFELFR
jgi:hypothetical protein